MNEETTHRIFQTNQSNTIEQTNLRDTVYRIESQNHTCNRSRSIR